MRKVRFCVSSAVLGVLVGLAGAVQAAGVGQPVPKFSLQGLDGRTYMPAEYEGRVLVLFFLGHN